ncbi:MAG: hypothetical protein HKN20_07975 [Gemmatimonadetes bacterium]|nr:hypothetical protein [Gemmatimonadota bacterium]
MFHYRKSNPFRIGTVVVALAIGSFLAGCAAMGSAFRAMQDLPDPVAPFVRGSPDSTGLLMVDCDAWYDPGHTLDFSRNILGQVVGDVIEDALHPRGELMWLRHARIVAPDDSTHGGKRTRYGSQPVILFSNLAPGIYKLTEIRATHDPLDEEVDEYYDCDRSTEETSSVLHDPCPVRFDFTYELSPESRDSLSIEIRAGETHYLGKLELTEEEMPPYDGVRTIRETEHGFLGFHVSTPAIDSRRRTNHTVTRIPSTAEDEIEGWTHVLETLDGPWAGTEDKSWVPIIQARISALRGEMAANE